MRTFNSLVKTRRPSASSSRIFTSPLRQSLRLAVLLSSAIVLLLFAQLYALRAVKQIGVPYVLGNRSPRQLRRNPQVGANLHDQQMRAAAAPVVFDVQMSSVLLWQCWKILTRSKEERMLVMTGIQSGGSWIISSFEEVEYLHASPLGVSADPQNTHRILQGYDDHGHVLLAVFHAHPGTGQWSARESSTDQEAQQRYENSGYASFTGIITHDGYVRVFTNSVNLRLSFYGKGVESLGHGYFKLHLT